MSKAEKLLEKMRTHPQDWRMESLEAVAKRYGIEVRKTGGSHFVFMHPGSELAVTVPFRRRSSRSMSHSSLLFWTT